LYNLSQGIDNRPVQTDRIRKSVSVENTFAEDLPSLESCLTALPDLERQLLKRIQSLKDSYQIQKQFVKIKFHDFVGTTVEMISSSTNTENYRTLCEQGFARGNKPVRLIGMGVKLTPLRENSDTQSPKLENDKEQLSLSLDS
jgi:DNA polymerase-4